MGRIKQLASNFESFVSLPWDQQLSGAEKTWFAIYTPSDERRLRCRVTEFEVAAKQAGHDWYLCDLTGLFAEWLAGLEYKEAYFEQPDYLASMRSDLLEYATQRVAAALTAPDVTQGTVVAILGVGSLFGFVRVHELLENTHQLVQGRLLVFFPGEHVGQSYRLFDAQDGWNYLAVPISA